MDDEEKLQSEIDLVSGDETGTPTRGATTGTDEGKGADDGGESDKGGTGTVSGSDGDGDGGGSGSVAGYTLYVTANPAAGASNIYVKKTSDSGFGSTQIQLVANTQYTLGVTAAQGYTFSGWYLNNSLYSNNTTFNYTASGRIGADMTFEARFTQNSGSTCTLTLNVTPSDSGTVSGAGTYPSNTNVTLTAIPNSGYSFIGWYEDTGGFTANSKALSFSPTYSFILKENKTIVAKFSGGEAISWVSPEVTNYNIYTYITVPSTMTTTFTLNTMQFNGANVNFSFVGASSEGKTTTRLSYMFTYDFEESVNLDEIEFDFDFYANVNGTPVHRGMTSIVSTHVINER